MSTGLSGGIAIAIKSNYTWTAEAERFMQKVIVGDLLKNLSINTLNGAVSIYYL